MKHGAKNCSYTRKILNNNNVHTHVHTHRHTCMHAPPSPPPHTHKHTHTHTHTHTHIIILATHTLLFWLTSNLKHSINYNKTKLLKQQNTKIKTLN